MNKLFANSYFNYGYFVRLNLYLFIKLNFITLIIIYICPNYFLSFIFTTFFLLYHLNLTFKTVSFQIQFYNINLGYFIMKIYRFVKKTSYYCLDQLNSYLVQRNSWLKKLFKYLFCILLLNCYLNSLDGSTLTLLTPSVTKLTSELAVKETLEKKETLKLLKKKLKQVLFVLKRRKKATDLETLSVINGLKSEIKTLSDSLKTKSNKVKVKVYEQKKHQTTLVVKGITFDESTDNYKSMYLKLFNAFTNHVVYKKIKNKSVVLKIVDIENDETKSLHIPVSLTNESIFTEYYDKISSYLKIFWKPKYGSIRSDEFLVVVYNLDQKVIPKSRKKAILGKKYYSTKVNDENYVEIADPKPVKKPSIKPIKLCKAGVKEFCSMDIETIIINKKTQQHIPIAISTHSKDFSKLFLIDLVLFKKNKDKAVKKLFKEYLDFMTSFKKFYIIFAHNLGGYDGYFLYRNLMSVISNVNLLECSVDPSNKFITINFIHGFKDEEGEERAIALTWKDSLRVYPGSLESLCKQFNVEGKLSKYKDEYNSIELFDNENLLDEFKKYSLQDSIALYNALKNAQDLYYKNYFIDICDVVSTANLSMKIYRAHFLHDEIPLLTEFEEKFIRESYLGGATDYYKAKGENLRCYDVNSLYPSAMMNELPYKVIAKHNDLSGVNVKDFKGFVLAKVTSPEYIRNPIVALKHEGRTIYPLGSWFGVYYADYLAKAQKFGYKIELISGIEFEYKKLFDGYINHFYDIKKNSTGSLRYLAKLKLNSLYGMFGRRSENLKVINVKNEEIAEMLKTKLIKNIIDLNNGYSILVCETNLDYLTVKKYNLKVDGDVMSLKKPTYANVAIASAITSEAQMKMMEYKNHPDFLVYYTDTDSLFTDKPIPEYLIGKELGLMKNETLDKYGVETISQATFIGLKKYGLRVIDNEGNIKDSSTFAGVPKDSLTFDEVNQIHEGTNLVKNLKDRFNKSFNSLNIKTQSNVKIEISNKRDKQLVNNDYLPQTVNLLEKQEFDSKLINKLVSRYNRLNKKLI